MDSLALGGSPAPSPWRNMGPIPNGTTFVGSISPQNRGCQHLSDAPTRRLPIRLPRSIRSHLQWLWVSPGGQTTSFHPEVEPLPVHPFLHFSGLIMALHCLPIRPFSERPVGAGVAHEEGVWGMPIATDT